MRSPLTLVYTGAILVPKHKLLRLGSMLGFSLGSKYLQNQSSIILSLDIAHPD